VYLLRSFSLRSFMQPLPPSSTKYSPQHTFQTPSVYVFPLMWKTKFHTHTKNKYNYSSAYLIWPISIAERSEASTVFGRSNVEIASLNPARGMDVCLRFSVLCCPVCR
jgi:hypothetical protein